MLDGGRLMSSCDVAVARLHNNLTLNASIIACLPRPFHLAYSLFADGLCAVCVRESCSTLL